MGTSAYSGLHTLDLRETTWLFEFIYFYLQAIFSTVAPGIHLRGRLCGQALFPSWLGKNSKKNKFDRLASELQMHMRLS
jgi:Replication factor RFC1 C terminal domain